MGIKKPATGRGVGETEEARNMRASGMIEASVGRSYFAEGVSFAATSCIACDLVKPAST